MASGGSKSAAFFLLIINLGLYFIVTVAAAWAVNHGIQRSRETGVRKLDATNSSSGSWDATCTQSQDNNLYVVRPILPTSTEHTRYITISL
jgi:hypothetical protein